MRFVSLALVVAVVAMADALKEKTFYDVNKAETLFENFIQQHNRKYTDDADKEVHFKAFKVNLEKINKMNEQNPTATFGINKFADYTEDERKNMFGHVAKRE